MTQCCHHLHESTNELGASHSCVFGFGLFCFVFVFGFVFCLFVLCVFAVCLVYDDDGPMDYVCTGPSPVLFCGPQQ